MKADLAELKAAAENLIFTFADLLQGSKQVLASCCRAQLHKSATSRAYTIRRVFIVSIDARYSWEMAIQQTGVLSTIYPVDDVLICAANAEVPADINLV